MPINQGARGLNLTVANNIIFVEPQLDASQLAQVLFWMITSTEIATRDFWRRLIFSGWNWSFDGSVFNVKKTNKT